MVKKTSRGRQRIPMEKMSNESSLQVTFSKRRSGIMKKSNELSTLTGAEMAVVIFSPGNRVFSFGKPTIETILNKFQNLQIPNNPQPNTNTLTETMYQLDQEGKLRKLNEETDLLKEECEVERKIKELMDQISEIEEKNNNLCSEDSIENHVGLLEKLKDAFQEFNQIVEKKVVKNQNILLEIQREHSFHFQNVFKHPHDVNIENTSGYMPTFGNYDVSRDVCGFSSQVYAAGPSIFGGGGFHFSQGEANSSMNNGVPMEAPEVGSYAGTSTFGGGGFQFIHGETNSSINNGVPMTAPAVCSYAEPSTFGGGGFQFIQGEASNNINNVARLAAPVVGSYAGTSTFGDGGFNFIQGEESSGINNGVPMAAPTIDSYAGTSTFVDGCFNIIQGEASSNINNGVPLAVPAVGGYTGPSTYVDSGFNFIQGEASCGINTSVPVAAPTIAGYAGTSTFGGDGFQFIQGEASSSLNTGIPVVAPTVGCYVGASTFGGSGGGASSSINNGVQMNVPPLAVAPSAVDRFVVPHYDPNIQDEVFFPAE